MDGVIGVTFIQMSSSAEEIGELSLSYLKAEIFNKEMPVWERLFCEISLCEACIGMVKVPP